jgi:7,8-dihydropterin-6-yl-methyl-4-(beta-D-ribofuranosyl)aminobenzene 5'-phosphate synthase
MCEDLGHVAERGAATPRAADRPAVDPIVLATVDEVTVTTLVDNTFDALLISSGDVVRPLMGTGVVTAPLFERGRTLVGLVAEHGFSALVTVRRDINTSTLLFDTGASPEAMAVNAERLGIDFADLQGVVLSHGHFDHAGGFSGLAPLRRGHGLPLTVHPGIWSHRRLALPGTEPVELPTLSAGALAREGFEIIERRQPSVLVEGSILVTGEVDRTTEFERGMPASHQAWDGQRWHHDAEVIDDQALVVNLRGKGLVVITGCGHAGIINIARHAMHLTGVHHVAAILGGFHLSGPAFEPIIGPTIAALVEMGPDLIVPGHCTGWRAQHALAQARPNAWAQSSSGTSYHLQAA